jgi:hypothetical protein
MPEPNLTARQTKYFASLRASLERDTDKTLAQWVAIARTCPEPAHRARLKWLKDNYGLLQNHGSHVLSEAFESAMSWQEPEKLIAALWVDQASTAIFRAVDALHRLVAQLSVCCGQADQGRQGDAGPGPDRRRQPPFRGAEE